MKTTHPQYPDYGWTTPVGADLSHYIQNARLIGKAGWLGWTICSMKSGGNAPLTAAPTGKVCPVCAEKTNYVRR